MTDDRWDDDTQDATDRRRRRLAVGGAAAAALVVAGTVAFAVNGGPGGRDGSVPDAQPVALSPDGLPPEVSDDDVAQGLQVAQDALARRLPRPEGAPTGANPHADIPAAMLTSYRRAEATAAREHPSCHVPWWLIAAIGKVESGHGTVGRPDGRGTSTVPIRGPRLDGTIVGTRMVVDTDEGSLDGDLQYDRAMGPLQYLPGTWLVAMRDGTGDGIANPDNVDDASVTTGHYLCSEGDDLATPQGLTRAVLRYNNTQPYLREVLGWGAFYASTVNPPRVAPAPASVAQPRAVTQTNGVVEGPTAPAILPPATRGEYGRQHADDPLAPHQTPPPERAQNPAGPNPGGGGVTRPSDGGATTAGSPPVPPPVGERPTDAPVPVPPTPTTDPGPVSPPTTARPVPTDPPTRPAEPEPDPPRRPTVDESPSTPREPDSARPTRDPSPSEPSGGGDSGSGSGSGSDSDKGSGTDKGSDGAGSSGGTHSDRAAASATEAASSAE